MPAACTASVARAVGGVERVDLAGAFVSLAFAHACCSLICSELHV